MDGFYLRALLLVSTGTGLCCRYIQLKRTVHLFQRPLMELKPIKTDADYRAALSEIERFFDAALGTPEGDRLEILVTLVEAYERRHFPMEAPDPIEALLHFMDSRGLSRRDLKAYIGSRARVAEVLNRKRALTLGMIQRLHAGLGIPANVLIEPYPVADAKAIA